MKVLFEILLYELFLSMISYLMSQFWHMLVIYCYFSMFALSIQNCQSDMNRIEPSAWLSTLEQWLVNFTLKTMIYALIEVGVWSFMCFI